MNNQLSFSSLVLAALVGNAGAAVSFAEDFSSNTAGPNMALGTGIGTIATDFTGDFTISSSNDDRIYLGTYDADYSTVDFVFQAMVTVVAGPAWNSAFFGMGTDDANSSFYGEPTTGSNLVMVLRPDVGYANTRDNAFVGTNPLSGTVAGTHLVTMTWNSTTMSATFDWDQGNNGSVDHTFMLDGSDNGFTAANSQLFLGGGGGVTFDNISVAAAPEPSATALLGLGGLALLLRRRR